MSETSYTYTDTVSYFRSMLCSRTTCGKEEPIFGSNHSYNVILVAASHARLSISFLSIRMHSRKRVLC